MIIMDPFKFVDLICEGKITTWKEAEETLPFKIDPVQYIENDFVNDYICEISDYDILWDKRDLNLPQAFYTVRSYLDELWEVLDQEEGEPVDPEKYQRLKDYYTNYIKTNEKL
jgi:hypothetical protein